MLKFVVDVDIGTEDVVGGFNEMRSYKMNNSS